MNHNQRIGKYGEGLAKDYIIRKGYTVLDLNYRHSNQEIDIIAKNKEKVVFIEVKTRLVGTLERPDEAVTNRKINNISNAASSYCLWKNIEMNDVGIDLIAIDIDHIRKIAKIRHYVDII